MSTLRRHFLFAPIVLGLTYVGIVGCDASVGIDLSTGHAARLIKDVYGYPREVLLRIPIEARWGKIESYGSTRNVVPFLEIFSPKSKGKDVPLEDDTREALLKLAVAKGWLKVEPNGDAPSVRFVVTEAGRKIFTADDEHLTATLGTGRFREVSGISGAVGADSYSIDYVDDIAVRPEWCGAGGRVLADDVITEYLSTTAYRYADGWRLQVN